MKYFDIIFFIVLILCFLFGVLFIKRWKYISKCLFLCIPILCFYCSFIYDGKEMVGKGTDFEDNSQRQEEQWNRQDRTQKGINQEKIEIDNAISAITDAIIHNQDIETQTELISKIFIMPRYIYKQIGEDIEQIDGKIKEINIVTGEAIQGQGNEKRKKLEEMKKAMKKLKHKINQNKLEKIQKIIEEIQQLNKEIDLIK